MNSTKPNNRLDQLKARLEKLDISYDIISHKLITTVEEGLKELGIPATDGVSTLIMSADGNYISIIRRDDHRISFKKIKKLVKAHDLRFADREKVKELTGCDIGYVSLYNEAFQPLMDATILERTYVYGGTGSPEHDLKIQPKDLALLTNAQTVDIVDDKIEA